MIKKGTTGIAKIYKGTTEIVKIYKGTELVYSSASEIIGTYILPQGSDWSDTYATTTPLLTDLGKIQIYAQEYGGTAWRLVWDKGDYLSSSFWPSTLGNYDSIKDCLGSVGFWFFDGDDFAEDQYGVNDFRAYLGMKIVVWS
jgi:hypothetical protein